MKKDESGNWKIQEAGKLPSWIVEIEEELSDFIIKVNPGDLNQKTDFNYRKQKHSTVGLAYYTFS